MKHVVIEIEQLECGRYEVRKGHLRAELLGKDEVLGCVASAIFLPDQRPMFMQTEDEIRRCNEAWKKPLELPAPITKEEVKT